MRQSSNLYVPGAGREHIWPDRMTSPVGPNLAFYHMAIVLYFPSFFLQPRSLRGRSVL